MKIPALAVAVLLTTTASGYSQAQSSRETIGVYMKGDMLNDFCRVYPSMRQKTWRTFGRGTLPASATAMSSRGRSVRGIENLLYRWGQRPFRDRDCSVLSLLSILRSATRPPIS